MTTTPPPPSPKVVEPTFALGQTIGHSNQFTITRVLGRGGFGEVFLAEEKRAQRRIAIKTMLTEHNGDQKLLRRFRGEYTLGSLLSHPSLVQMFDLCVSPEGVNYIVMEYIDGESLASRLYREEKANGQLGLDAALHFGWQISSILAQLHSKKTIHRDLKPGNIMVVADPATHGGWRYKLIDFGIAKLLDRDQAKSLEVEAHTTTGMFVGTPKWSSPDNFKGGKVQGPASDVYSLGCILYRCIAGSNPFESDDPAEVIRQHLQDEPIPLTAEDPGVPHDVADLIHSMMEKDPAKRPTMEQVAEFFARKLGLAPASAGQIVVRGGTQELQAVLADLSTGAVSTGALSKTEDGSLKYEIAEDKSVPKGQLLATPSTPPKRQRQLTRVAVGLAVAVVLSLGALVLRQIGTPASHQEATAALRILTVAPSVGPAPDAGTPPPKLPGGDASGANPATAIKPSATIPTNPDGKPSAADKKRKKKKGRHLFTE